MATSGRGDGTQCTGRCAYSQKVERKGRRRGRERERKKKKKTANERDAER
jgi:hypothetical protein